MTVNARPAVLSVRGGTHSAVALADAVKPPISAVIVDVPGELATNTPCWSIVPPPKLTCQVGDTCTKLLHSSKPVAENTTESRGLTVAFAGRTRTVRVAPAVAVTLAVVASEPRRA